VTAYRQALDAGAERLVSIHLSAELSGTSDAARLAASQVGEHIVSVVDSRSAAMGCGFAVLAAARTAAAGGDAGEVAEMARRTAARTSTFFVVDTLEHLRRGGRIGGAAAVLGSALAVKPVLHVQDGRVVPLEKVRTTARANHRLVQRAVEAAGDGPVSVAVHHWTPPTVPTGSPPSCASACRRCASCTSASSVPLSGRTSGPARSASSWRRFWEQPDEDIPRDLADD
jgi:DegV family protein with EDD domain